MEKKLYGRFLKVVCSRCGNKQIIFGKSSTQIKCSVCGRLLLRSTGGKVRIKTLVLKVFSQQADRVEVKNEIKRG